MLIFFNKFRFACLLSSLLVYLVVYPIINHYPHANLVFNLFVSLTLLSGVAAVSTKKKYVLLFSILACPYLISIWGETFLNPTFQPFGLLFGVIYYLFLTCLILIISIRSRHVSMETIYAALSGYLLIGISWSLIYAFIYANFPEGFHITSEIDVNLKYEFLYFSLVTLTTLGFGDISPTHPISQSWVVLEAVIGQIYMVVLVAGLVGLFITQKSTDSK